GVCLVSRYRRSLAVQTLDGPARGRAGLDVACLGTRVERGPGAASLRPARLAIGKRPLEQRPAHAPPLVTGEHEEHGEVPPTATDQSRDHGTNLPFLDGAEVDVWNACQAGSGI